MKQWAWIPLAAERLIGRNLATTTVAFFEFTIQQENIPEAVAQWASQCTRRRAMHPKCSEGKTGEILQ